MRWRFMPWSNFGMRILIRNPHPFSAIVSSPSGYRPFNCYPATTPAAGYRKQAKKKLDATLKALSPTGSFLVSQVKEADGGQ